MRGMRESGETKGEKKLEDIRGREGQRESSQSLLSKRVRERQISRARESIYIDRRWRERGRKCWRESDRGRERKRARERK